MQMIPNSIIALSHTDHSETRRVSLVHVCIAWFCFNGLAILESILFGSWQRLHAFTLLSSIDLAGTALPLSDTVNTLGVTLDSKITFRPHITNLCKSCFYHIKAIRHIRSALNEDILQTIACSLASSRLDHANSLLWVSLTYKSEGCNALETPWLASCCVSHYEKHAHQSIDVKKRFRFVIIFIKKAFTNVLYFLKFFFEWPISFIPLNLLNSYIKRLSSNRFNIAAIRSSLMKSHSSQTLSCTL